MCEHLKKSHFWPPNPLSLIHLELRQGKNLINLLWLEEVHDAVCCVPALAHDKLMILDGTENEITLRISQIFSVECFCMKSALLEQIFQEYSADAARKKVHFSTLY